MLKLFASLVLFLSIGVSLPQPRAYAACETCNELNSIELAALDLLTAVSDLREAIVDADDPRLLGGLPPLNSFDARVQQIRHFAGLSFATLDAEQAVLSLMMFIAQDAHDDLKAAMEELESENQLKEPFRRFIEAQLDPDVARATFSLTSKANDLFALLDLPCVQCD